MHHQKKIILLAGPTASGKSKLAIILAKKLKGEIINADSMQVYKEISVLTSKPYKLELKYPKHHLYGTISVKKEFSTGNWLKLTNKKIKDCLNQNKVPIVVGGTGLYFKVLTEGLVRIPNIPKSLRKKVRNLHKKIGQIKFYNKLVKLDPYSRNFIVPTDAQRTLRAYEVKKFTNKSLFNWIGKTKSIYKKNNFIKLFINIPKEELKEKIDSRVEKMFSNNVLDEVKNFLKMKIDKEHSSNKIIGIKEIGDYLSKKLTLLETKDLIKLRTRQYAKRQYTWARGHMKSWNMIYSSNFKDLFEKVMNKIS